MSVRETMLDKMRGTTLRQAAYCRRHGLGNIKDLKISWLPGKQYIYEHMRK